jgi:hypothetical protein
MSKGGFASLSLNEKVMSIFYSFGNLLTGD